MKKINLKKLFVGLACLTTLASCDNKNDNNKVDCFSPKYCVLGVNLYLEEKTGVKIGFSPTYDEFIGYLEKVKDKGVKKEEKEIVEHGVVCEKCCDWKDSYLWDKSDTCECGGKYHDCDLTTFYYSDGEFGFAITYVTGKYSGTDEIWTQR